MQIQFTIQAEVSLLGSHNDIRSVLELFILSMYIMHGI